MVRPAKPTNPPASQTSSRDEEKDKKSHSKPKDLSHVPCKFFKVGQCTAGSSCPFSHALHEPGQPKQACQWFVQGNCRFGHKCALAHIMPGEPISMDRKNKKAAQQALQAQNASNVPTNAEAPSQSGRSEKRDQDRQNKKDRDRSSRREHRERGGQKKSSERQSDRYDDASPARTEDNNMTSSVATLRPPIRIGLKGPTSSASVTAPPVLRDTSAGGKMNDTDSERGWATASLEHLQAQARQLPSTPATEAAPMSDYSKTPSANFSDLPPHPSASTSPPRKETQSPSILSRALGRSAGVPVHQPRPSEGSIRNGNAQTISPPNASNLGPIGSPPRAGPLTSGATSPGRSALSHLLGGLSLNQPQTSFTQTNPRLDATDMPHQEEAASSITSQSSLHAHMNANILGTSPFSMPGSRSLYMPVSSSVTSQTNVPQYGAGTNNGGVPASFAGHRAIGWGAAPGDVRRPSLPGHHARPSLGATSIKSGVLEGSPFEENEEEELEAEEFLPSSLNDLLTQEERARKFSRSGGARPTKDHLLGRSNGPSVLDEEGDDAWQEAVRPHNNHAAMEFSRSVPATGILGNVRSLWENDSTRAPPYAEGNGPRLPSDLPSHPMHRSVSSTSGHQELFGPISGSYGPSPSMLSSSVRSNASNAFLKTAAASGRPIGGIATVNDLQIGSYNPQSVFNSKPQATPHPSHQQHASISALPSNTHSNQPSGLATQFGLNGQPKATAGFYGLHQPQPQRVVRDDNAVLPGHEPGQSLPRGLGAGLSRLHFVPAMSLSSIGSPTNMGFGSPNSVASPPGYSTQFGATAGGTTPTRMYGSGLTARLASARGLSQVNDLDENAGYGNFHPQAHRGGDWVTGVAGGAPVHGNMEDEVVDEGTLWNMD